jgi:circadian clock protein KaiC
VIKKRSGRHEETIRQISMDEHGLHLSEPLTYLRGVLTGVPEISDKESERAVHNSPPANVT